MTFSSIIGYLLKGPPCQPVKTLYEALSQQKKKITNESVLVFWDVKCLNVGQNWERGFLQGLAHSSIIILLVSQKTLDTVKQQAPKQQDNVLVEYECAILQNKLKGTTVTPVFIAGAERDKESGEIQFYPFDFKELDPAKFPQVPHTRSRDVQYIIDDLSKSLPSHEKEFLNSISGTIEQLKKLQGECLHKRGTDPQELNHFITRMMEEL